jgi:hypothetical protein
MNWNGAWKWMAALAAAVVAARTNLLQGVLSILLVLALASAIVFSFALFSMDFVATMASGLEFLERRIRHAVDRTRAMLAHSLHPLSSCADPRQGFFLLLPLLVKPIGRGIRRLLQPQWGRRVKFIPSVRKDGEELTVSREFR